MARTFLFQVALLISVRKAFQNMLDYKEVRQRERRILMMAVTSYSRFKSNLKRRYGVVDPLRNKIRSRIRDVFSLASLVFASNLRALVVESEQAYNQSLMAEINQRLAQIKAPSQACTCRQLYSTRFDMTLIRSQLSNLLPFEIFSSFLRCQSWATAHREVFRRAALTTKKICRLQQRFRTQRQRAQDRLLVFELAWNKALKTVKIKANAKSAKSLRDLIPKMDAVDKETQQTLAAKYLTRCSELYALFYLQWRRHHLSQQRDNPFQKQRGIYLTVPPEAEI